MIRRRTTKIRNISAREITVPKKSDVTRWSYYKRVGRAMVDMNEESYRTYLSPSILATHFNWMDAEWEKAQRALAKPKSVRKQQKARPNDLRRRRLQGNKITKTTPRPSLSFSNKILTRYGSLIDKAEKDITKYSVPPKVQPKRKPKITRQEKLILLKKSFSNYATYYSHFIQVYYDIHGLTKQLITSLLKTKSYEYISLFYNLYLIDNKLEQQEIEQQEIEQQETEGDHKIGLKFVRSFVDPNYVDTDVYEQLHEYAMPVDRDIHIYLKISSEEEILQNLTTLFDETEILNNLPLIRYPSVITHLVRESIIKVDKKLVKSQFKNLQFSTVIPIIDTGRYSPTISEINSIFKPSIPKKRRRRRYYWYRRTTYNSKLSSKTEDIDLLLRSLIRQNIKIPYSKGIHSYLMAHGTPELIDTVLQSQNIPEYPFDTKWEKLRESVNFKSGRYSYKANEMLNTVIDKDDLDGFKILIDQNLLPIQELHHNNRYLINAIVNSSTKIATYMIEDLRVKLLNWNFRSLWGWRFSRKSEERMIEDIRFIIDHGIPIDRDVIGIFLSNKKYKVFDYLVEELGFKPDRSHLKYIKYMDVKSFNKYVDQIGVDKLRLLPSLARHKKEQRYGWWRRNDSIKQRKKNAIVLSIISSQPRNEKKKLAKRIGQIALNNNNSVLHNTLKSRYRFGYTLKEVKAIINKPSYRCGSHKLLTTLKTSQPDIYAALKDEDNDLKIRMLTNQIEQRHMSSELAQNMIDLNMVPTIKLIKSFIDVASQTDRVHWWWEPPSLNSDTQSFLARIIRLLPEYKSREPAILKPLTLSILQKNGISLINTLSSKNYDLLSTLTLKDIYTICIQSMVKNKDLNSVHRMLSAYKKNTSLTPLIWTLIRIGIRYTELDDNWNRIRITKGVVGKLLTLQNEMVNEDREFFKEYIDKKRVKIVKYEPTDDELPDDYNFYIRFIANRDNMNDDVSEDMELALDAVEEDLLAELGGVIYDLDIIGQGDVMDVDLSMSDTDGMDSDSSETEANDLEIINR